MIFLEDQSPGVVGSRSTIAVLDESDDGRRIYIRASTPGQIPIDVELTREQAMKLMVYLGYVVQGLDDA